MTKYEIVHYALIGIRHEINKNWDKMIELKDLERNNQLVRKEMELKSIEDSLKPIKLKKEVSLFPIHNSSVSYEQMISDLEVAENELIEYMLEEMENENN